MECSDGDCDDFWAETRSLFVGGGGISRAPSPNAPSKARLRFIRCNEPRRAFGGGVAMWYDGGRRIGFAAPKNSGGDFVCGDSEESAVSAVDSKSEKLSGARPTPWSTSEILLSRGQQLLRNET